LVIGLVAGMLLSATAARAQEEKCLRPELEQLLQTVAEKFQEAADKLGLNDDQRAKIREIHAKHVEEYKTLRTERRELLEAEMRALGDILTPEQREKAKEFVKDRIETAERGGGPGLPHFVAERGTLAERVQAAADKLELSADQRKQIVKTLASYAGRHTALRAKCRDAIESEVKEVAAVLTPEQRQKASDYIHDRVVRAEAAMSIADRLDAVADKLGLSADQRKQIVQTLAEFASKYRHLRAERRELLQEELRAIGAILTPEQREKVKNFVEDRVVIVQVSATGRDAAEAAQALRETIKDRLEAVADKLGLTDDQKAKIRDAHAAFAEKFQAQRDQRKALREEEMKALGAILTAEQREKVKHFVEDHVETEK
jgi:Spy/CpxP family protein refolding chaperone